MSTIEVCQDLKVVKKSTDLKQVKEILDKMNPVCDAFNTCCQKINRKISILLWPPVGLRPCQRSSPTEFVGDWINNLDHSIPILSIAPSSSINLTVSKTNLMTTLGFLYIGLLCISCMMFYNYEKRLGICFACKASRLGVGFRMTQIFLSLKGFI